MCINGIFDAKICVVKGKCGMKLSVCNIAWTAEHDAKMYGKMKELGMEGTSVCGTVKKGVRAFGRLHAVDLVSENREAVWQ